MTDNNFKYLSEEFAAEPLKLVKQKGVYQDDCISKKDYSHVINFECV